MRPASRTPDNTTVFAIGDVHGRLDLLSRLLELISADLAQSEQTTVIMVFLGDYIDRGPDSRRVIDQLIKLKQAGGDRIITLKGNHEDALLTFLSDPASGPAWADHGGRETLLSYGVEVPKRRTDAEEWKEAHAIFKAAMPKSHLDFYHALRISEHCGDYFFAHAGVRPQIPLEDQEERDLLWIRDDFLHHGRSLAKVVVHGHTPTETPFASDYRIGIDTGAYATGILTALKLHGDTRSFLQTGGESSVRS